MLFYSANTRMTLDMTSCWLHNTYQKPRGYSDYAFANVYLTEEHPMEGNKESLARQERKFS